jgi:hypothetical protein
VAVASIGVVLLLFRAALRTHRMLVRIVLFALGLRWASAIVLGRTLAVKARGVAFKSGRAVVGGDHGEFPVQVHDGRIRKKHTLDSRPLSAKGLTRMPEREMTPEERERFEREQVQHREREQGVSGPASESEHAAEGDEGPSPRAVIPNPD